jgi:hypothetical protein
MDTRKHILKLAMVFVSIAFGIITLFSRTAMCQGGGSQEIRIISIFTETDFNNHTVTHLEPQSTWVDRYTTVVWHNRSDHGVKIIFPKGEECKKATEAALNFKIATGTGTATCYVTDEYIPQGGTASALFKDLGKYEYEIEFSGLSAKEKGTIFVKTGSLNPPSIRGH